MKKKILKVVAGVSLMMTMAVGFLMNNVQNESSVMMEHLEAVAMAGSESSTDYCRQYCSYNPYYYCILETSSSYIWCNDKYPNI